MPKRRVDEQQGRAALAAWERAYVAAHAPTAPDSTAADSTTVDPELPRPVLFTAVRGFLADIPVEKVVKFQEDFIKFMHASYADIGKKIAEQKKLDDALEAEIKKCIEGFKETISYRVKE